jgi:S-adenosylmethionine:tRNA ribosyltransferase-isomerase
MQRNDVTKLNGHTGICITPAYTLKVARALITNFHQPQSTLLLLIASFVGNRWKEIYNEALANDYRFLSYGDGSILFADES